MQTEICVLGSFMLNGMREPDQSRKGGHWVQVRRKTMKQLQIYPLSTTTLPLKSIIELKQYTCNF